MNVKQFPSLAIASFQEWLEDRAPNEAAALAYYTLLSVPALLLLIQWLLGRVVSVEVQEQVTTLITESVQGRGGEIITDLIENADSPGSSGGLASIVSLVTLAVSATGVVVHLEQALNRMWEIAEEDAGLIDKVRERLSSLLVVVALGAFLLISVSVSTAVSGFAETLTGVLPVGEWFIQLVNALVSLALLTVLFASAFKVIPDAEVDWSDVWLGATVTAVLFIVGQTVLAFYLGKSAPGSAYGTAGSIVAFVVWVYYSAMIMFLGAEFTQVYANRFGSKIRPDDSAIPLAEKMSREQLHPSQEPARETDNNRSTAATSGHATRQTMSNTAPAAQPPQPATGAAEGSRSYTRRPPLQEAEKNQNTVYYYAVAVVAVALGVWRWVSGRSDTG